MRIKKVNSDVIKLYETSQVNIGTYQMVQEQLEPFLQPNIT